MPHGATWCYLRPHGTYGSGHLGHVGQFEAKWDPMGNTGALLVAKGGSISNIKNSYYGTGPASSKAAGHNCASAHLTTNNSRHAQSGPLALPLVIRRVQNVLSGVPMIPSYSGTSSARPGARQPSQPPAPRLGAGPDRCRPKDLVQIRAFVMSQPA